MRIAIFDTITGQILRTATVPAGSANLNVGPGEDWVAADTEQDDTHYVDVTTLQFIAFPPRPSEFYTWDWTTKAWDPDLASAKREKIRLVLAEYYVRKELPIVYDSKTLDTNDEAREQLMFKAFEFAERARLNQPAGAASRIWENADGTFHMFATDAGFRNWLGGFVITLSDHVAQLRIAVRNHVQNIRALTTVEAVIAYDITVGWPP